MQLVLNDGSLYSQEGRIESISGVIDTSTGSVQLRDVFPNPGRLLHSGSSGNVLVVPSFWNCRIRCSSWGMLPQLTLTRKV